MLRPFAMLLAAAAAAPAALAQRDDLIVMLRDPAGKAVLAANAHLACRPASRLTALGPVPPLARAASMPIGRTLVATSDARGYVRVPTDEAEGVLAGSGLVTHADGLGALIVDLQPGRTQRLLLEPMAGVTSARDGEEFTLFARALLPAGRTVVLPPMRGARVLLPAGAYEAWAHGERGWIWQRLHLVSGRMESLQFDGPAQQLRSSGNYVHPDGRPRSTCSAGAARRRCAPARWPRRSSRGPPTPCSARRCCRVPCRTCR